VSGKNIGDPPELPIKLTATLTKAISKARDKLLKRKPDDRALLKEVVDSVRCEFFTFFLAILKNYKLGTVK
jgi:hypothetical protein